jgi:hypothetical protein
LSQRHRRELERKDRREQSGQDSPHECLFFRGSRAAIATRPKRSDDRLDFRLASRKPRQRLDGACRGLRTSNKGVAPLPEPA